MKKPLKIRNFHIKCYILCEHAERYVLLTVSHVTMKPSCLLLLFILQFRASVKAHFSGREGKHPVVLVM